ncbi:MAG: methionyl-tRNA formyltransferase [Bacteroidota bacterium]
MNIRSLRIVYMGTPEFAVAPLKTLIDAGCNVVAVITAPDKPAGRGKKIRMSALKQFALKQDHEIAILQPSNLKDPDFVKDLTNLQPDLQVVVAFRMLPESVWRLPRLGTFNLHASLLPQYRGAAPINHAIINGETETGVTTFMIDEQIDTGSILLQKRTSISDQETAGDLHDRLMSLGAGVVMETVTQLAAGTLQAQSQERFIPQHADLKKAPKIFREHCKIPWDLPGKRIHNLIRGLSPYPGAFTNLEKPDRAKLLCKIYAATFEDAEQPESPGTILSDGKSFIKVATCDGYLQIQSIQLEGKRRMEVRDFLAGFSLSSGLYRFS